MKKPKDKWALLNEDRSGSQPKDKWALLNEDRSEPEESSIIDKAKEYLSGLGTSIAESDPIQDIARKSKLVQEASKRGSIAPISPEQRYGSISDGSPSLKGEMEYLNRSQEVKPKWYQYPLTEPVSKLPNIHPVIGVAKAIEQTQKIPKTDSKFLEGLAGIAEAGGGFAKGMTTPEMIAPIVGAMIPGPQQPFVAASLAAYFAPHIVHGGIEAGKEYVEGSKEGDTRKTIRGLANLIGSGLIGKGLLKHGKGIEDAAIQRELERSNKPEYPPPDSGRPSAEAGGGNRPVEGGEGKRPVWKDKEELERLNKAFDERMNPKPKSEPVEDKGITLYDDKGEPVLVKDGKMYKEFKPQEPTIETPIVPTPRVDVPAPKVEPVIEAPKAELPTPLVKEVIPPPQKARQNVGGIRTTGAFTQPEPYEGPVGWLGKKGGPNISVKLDKNAKYRRLTKPKGLLGDIYKEIEAKAKEAIEELDKKKKEEERLRKIRELDEQRLSTFREPKVVNPNPILYDYFERPIVKEAPAESAITEQVKTKPIIKERPVEYSETPNLKGELAKEKLIKMPSELSKTEIEDLITFRMTGNKTKLIYDSIGKLVEKAAETSNRFLDLFGGAGTYTHYLAKTGKLPKGSKMNEIDPLRTIAHNQVKTNAKSVISELNRYKNIILDFLKDIPDRVIFSQVHKDALDKVSNYLYSELEKEIVPNQNIAQLHQNGLPIEFNNNAKVAALYHIIQENTFGNIPFNADVGPKGLIRKGVNKLITSVSGIAKIRYNTFDKIISRINDASGRLKDVDLTRGDGWKGLDNAVKNDFTALDTSYLNKEKKTTNYNAFTSEDANIDVYVDKLKKHVLPAHARGVKMLITNEYNPFLADFLRRNGFDVSIAPRAKGQAKEVSYEIIAKNFDSETGLFKDFRAENYSGRDAGPAVYADRSSGFGLGRSKDVGAASAEGLATGAIREGSSGVRGTAGIKGTPTKEAIEKSPVDVKINSKETPYTIVDRNGVPLKSVETADQIVSAIEGTAPAPKIGSTLLKSRPNDLKATIDPDFDGEPLTIETRPLKDGRTIIYDSTTRVRTNIVGDSPREAMDKAKIIFKNNRFEETYTPRTAQRVELKAIEEGLTKGFEDMPVKDKVHIADQAELAYKLIKNDWEFARRIINGQEKTPGRLRPESLWLAMDTIARQSKDLDLMKELAKSPIVTETISEAGKTLSMIQNIDKDSPTYKLMEISKAREEIVKQRYGKDIKQAEAKIEAEIDKFVKRRSPSKGDWLNFVESIKCK